MNVAGSSAPAVTSAATDPVASSVGGSPASSMPSERSPSATARSSSCTVADSVSPDATGTSFSTLMTKALAGGVTLSPSKSVATITDDRSIARSASSPLRQHGRAGR